MNAHTQAAPAAPTPDKISLGYAKYFVSPDSTARDLLNDAELWLSTLRDSLHALIIGLEVDGDLSVNPRIAAGSLYGDLRTVDMLQGCICAAQSRIAR